MAYITPPSADEIKQLAKAVHDEIYSIENTLNRRGYKYAGQGSPNSLILPKDISQSHVTTFYKYMSSRTFRNILKDIVTRKQDFLPVQYTKECRETKIFEWFNFLANAKIIECNKRTSLYNIKIRANDFGSTLEWYVAELFKKELSSTADWGVKIKNIQPGGGFDVMARVESTLVWIEVKSTNPKNITESDIRYFLQRDQNLDPDISIFFVDTNSDLLSLIKVFEDVLTPVIAEDALKRDSDYRYKIEQLTDFGGIYYPMRRMFVINSKPSILTNIRYCLNYYFAIVTQTSYVSRTSRMNFLNG